MITGSLHTLVLALQFYAVAHCARVAMVEFVTSSDTTKSTFIAMEYLLLLGSVVKEIAFFTEI
jgi:hypothetical protein